jgi:hemerythrin superfamily protein
MVMKNEPKDALALLVADHEKVRTLFKQFEELSDRATVSKKKIADQICKELTIHAEVEEAIFYPAVRDLLQETEVLDEAVVEHSGAKNLIEQIKEMQPGDDLYDAKVKVLSEQINHHVKEEEGDMFTRIRKGKKNIDLMSLGEEMAVFREECSSRYSA